ncbi:MAG: tyramine oxidase, partial [Dehalococcoidia bacterium]|nr:tyramine oxidase [Dehalococcoidia bacterium]
MAICHGVRTDAGTAQFVTHPLDPLTAEEIAEASSILKSQRALGPRVRFETIVLKEPDKEDVLGFRNGAPIRRHAFLVVLDNDDEATYEATVCLD